MDILEYAKKMEKDGELYYRELAERNRNNPGVNRIMTMLADEEVRHFNIVSEMASRTPAPLESDILSNVKNVFIEMRERNETVDNVGAQVDMYLKAQAIEKESQEFYEKCMKQSDNENNRKIFNMLAKEEQKHYFILDNFVEFLSRPQLWLENAEWNHLEEY